MDRARLGALHQGLVVLAGALLVASGAAVVAAVDAVRRARGDFPDDELLVVLAQTSTGALAWLVLCPVLVGVPRLLGLPERGREARWATFVLWASALLGVLLALVNVVGLALAFLPGDSPTIWAERATILGTALVAVAVAALSLNALGAQPPDA